MRRAEPIAGLGGILLLVSLFLPWSGVAIITRGSAGSERTDWLSTANGWQTLAVIDVLLAALALLAIAVPVVSLTTRGPAKSIGTAVIASALGWIARRARRHPAVRLTTRGCLGRARSRAPRLGRQLALPARRVDPGALVPELPRRPAPAP